MSKRVNRHELKFYISNSDYIANKFVLQKLMKRDEYQKSDEGYFIRSLYFDDLHDSSVEEKLDGTEYRDKFRLRIYDFDQDWVKLERKRKNNNYVEKATFKLTRDEAQKLINGDVDWLGGYDSKTARSLYANFKTRHLRPASIVDYYREAYILDYNQIRITFDRRLSVNDHDFRLFSKDIITPQLLPDNVTIMEIKYGNFLPPWFKDLMHLNNGYSAAISKYTQSRLMSGEYTN